MASKCPPAVQDWEPTVLRKSAAARRAEKTQRTAAALRAGTAETTTKVTGEQRARSDKNRKLDDAHDAERVATVGVDFGRALLQARNAKKLTQKQLAAQLNIKPAVIQEYEQGKAQPNGQLISRLDRALGCKLPRPAAKRVGS